MTDTMIDVEMNQPVPTEPGVYLYIDQRGVTHVAHLKLEKGRLVMLWNHQYGLTSSMEHAHEVSWSKRLSFRTAQ